MSVEISEIDLFYRFGIALVIGLLVGLQREYDFRRQHGNDEHLFAGTRTFGLIALAGCSAAFAADLLDAPLVFVAILIIAGALITSAYVAVATAGDRGQTTEVAALLVLLTGAFCYWDQIALAGALGVTTTVLLTLKLHTQTLARRLTREDVFATIKFAVITVIILPILPREPFAPAPFDVLIPYRIWLMVVFISGISFLGYVLIQLVGARRGVGLTGILGGLASSTAVTLTFSERSRDTEELATPFALAILLAWTIMFIRVIVEVAAINPALTASVWRPMVAACVATLAYVAFLYFRHGARSEESAAGFKNPFELGPAITFGLIYAVILVGANAARLYLGEAGIYASSIASGLADVDAITLSMASLSRGDGGIAPEIATRAIVLAAVSNTLVKGGIVLASGSPALRKRILPGLALPIAAALLVAFVF